MKLTGKVHQVGSGGIGFWMAAALARQQVDLVVYDYDNFVGGLGWSRLPKVSNPETKKVSFLRGFCAAVMGDKAPKVFDTKFNGLQCYAGDLVVDCSDMDLTLRKAIWESCRSYGARCLRVSYDGRSNTVVVAEGLPLVGRPGGGYVEAPSLALSMAAGGIGALVVQQILAGHEQHVEFQVSVAELIKGYHSAATVGEDVYDIPWSNNPHDMDQYDATCNNMSPCDMVTEVEEEIA